MITPIGEPETRLEFQGVIDAVIKPVMTERGYKVIAAHEKSDSGSITKGIIESILESQIVITNITEGNSNVMYETAFAHSLRKPVIHLLRSGSTAPFDIKDNRYINYTDTMIGTIDLITELKKFVIEIEENPNTISNPIVDSVDTWKVIEPREHSQDLIDLVKGISRQMSRLENRMSEYEVLRKNVNSNNDIVRSQRRYDFNESLILRKVSQELEDESTSLKSATRNVSKMLGIPIDQIVKIVSNNSSYFDKNIMSKKDSFFFDYGENDAV